MNSNGASPLREARFGHGPIAAHRCWSCHSNLQGVVGLLGLKEGLRVLRVCQVKLGMAAQQQMAVAGRLQAAHDGAAHQGAVAGDVDLGRN